MTKADDDALVVALQRLSTQIIDGVEKRLAGRFQQIDVRFQQIDGRLDGMDGRLNGIDVRLDGMDVQFEQLDGRLSTLERAYQDLERSMLRGFQRLTGEIEGIRNLFLTKEEQATPKKRSPSPRPAA